MTFKLRVGIILLVIAFCALTCVVSAASAVKSDTDNSDLEAIIADFEAETEENVGDLDAGVSEGAEEEVSDILAEEELLFAAEKLSTELTDSEIEEVLKEVYDTMDGVALVYVITPKGVISSIYPDGYSDSIGDFIGRSPVGSMIIKAREYIRTDEYTSAREKITGYDAVQPILSEDGEYLGAVIAKIVTTVEASEENLEDDQESLDDSE